MGTVTMKFSVEVETNSSLYPAPGHDNQNLSGLNWDIIVEVEQVEQLPQQEQQQLIKEVVKQVEQQQHQEQQIEQEIRQKVCHLCPRKPEKYPPQEGPFRSMEDPRRWRHQHPQLLQRRGS